MKKSLRCGVLGLAIMAALSTFLVVNANAQGTPAPTTAPSNVVKLTRPYYVEGAVVVGLMAAAVVAVCRSSRRV